MQVAVPLPQVLVRLATWDPQGAAAPQTEWASGRGGRRARVRVCTRT